MREGRQAEQHKNPSDAGGSGGIGGNGGGGHNNADNMERWGTRLRLVPGAIFARFRYKYITVEICLCEMKRAKDNSYKCC